MTEALVTTLAAALAARERVVLAPEGRTVAAVLVPLLAIEGEPSILFTRRAVGLPHHQGQVAFPGGRHHPGEDADLAATALREAQEEIGLAQERAELLGRLPEYVTVTGYRVTPVVALVSPPLDLRPDPFEVAEIFEVPLAFLLDPANHLRNTVLQEGKRRRYYAMPFREYYIWGATAGMLMNLYGFLRA